MIVEGFLTVLAEVIGFIGGLFPAIDAPAFLGSITSGVNTVVGHMAPLGVWLPFGAAGTAVQFVIAAAGVALVVKLIRVVASFFTAGGGSAA